MTVLWILTGVAVFLAVAALVTALICFYRIFYSPRQKEEDPYPIPEGEIYEPYREQMVDYIKAADAMPHKCFAIRSFDGLTLRGKYYEYKKGAPIEIMFHGYRGSARRDMSGGIHRSFSVGHNALVVDHRGSGESDGHVITFGVRESRDCLLWRDLVLREIDPGAKIILTGISMGAATVMIAAADEHPENVVGVLADCGYTSARAIIKKVIREMGLPADLLYPFARLGARLFGGFDPDERAPVESMKRSRLPVIFFHGDTDDFVPYEMSEENCEACVTEKRLVKIDGAGHGLCFVRDPERYVAALREFFDPLTGTDYNQ